MRSKLWGTVIFVIIGIIIGILQPLAGLPLQGHIVLAVVIIALGLWIFRPGNLPYTAGAAVLLAGCLIAGLGFPAVMGGYANSSLWVLIPALYFGFVLQKTGLGRRIAFLVLQSFRPSYVNIILAWLIIGIALSLLTPSITVRVAIVVPIALSCVEACKLAYGSRGAALINLVAWAMAVIPGTGWLTGSLWGPIFVGFYPPEISALGTWGAWFQIMALPWLVVTLLFLVITYFLLRPDTPLNITRDTFREQYKNLGPISHDEIVVLVVLVASFAFFVTESVHYIPTAATALAALFALMAFRIINVSEVGTGVSWDTLLFLGAGLGLPGILAQANVSGWMVGVLGPLVTSIASNPVLLVIVFTLLLWAIRFIDVPWGLTTIAVSIPLLVPLYQDFNIHPIVITMAFTAAGNCFFMSYQQPFAMMAEAIAQGKAWESRQISLAGIAYAVAVVIAILVSTPYWGAIGAIP